MIRYIAEDGWIFNGTPEHDCSALVIIHNKDQNGKLQDLKADVLIWSYSRQEWHDIGGRRYFYIICWRPINMPTAVRVPDDGQTFLRLQKDA